MSALRQTKGASRVPGGGAADLYGLLRHQAADGNPVPVRLSLSRQRARASTGRRAAAAGAGFVGRRPDDARLEPPSVRAPVPDPDVRERVRTAGTAARWSQCASRIRVGTPHRRRCGGDGGSAGGHVRDREPRSDLRTSFWRRRAKEPVHPSIAMPRSYSAGSNKACATCTSRCAARAGGFWPSSSGCSRSSRPTPAARRPTRCRA